MIIVLFVKRSLESVLSEGKWLDLWGKFCDLYLHLSAFPVECGDLNRKEVKAIDAVHGTISSFSHCLSFKRF